MKFAKEILLKLKMSRGMSNLSIWKIVKSFYEIEETFQLTAFDFAKLAHLSGTKNEFITSFNAITDDDLKKIMKTHQMITIYDQEYPELLRTIYNAPVILFYRGNLEILQNKKKLAFVGSRDANLIGIASTRRLIRDLPTGFVIVSGGARGIDTVAHQTALKTQKRTICVVGSGLNQVYPSENRELFAHLAQNELILSEYFNDEPPLKFHFPDRNRIIAGLSSGVVVVQAKERSGSLITSDRALEEGREVFAVPGDIISKKFTGCLKLIQQGAKCVYTADDITSELNF